MAASDFSGNLQNFRRVYLESLPLKLPEYFMNFFYENVLVCSANVLLINALYFI